MTRSRSPTAETSHPLCDIGLKTDAGLFPVGRNIDADVVLLDQDMSDPLENRFALFGMLPPEAV